MSRKTSLDKIRGAVQRGQGWVTAEAPEKTWGESYTTLFFFDQAAWVRAIEDFQTLVVAAIEQGSDNGLWREQRRIESLRVGFAVRFKDNGSIDGAVTLHPDIDYVYLNDGDEDTRKDYVYGVSGAGHFYKPETRKLSDVEGWVQTRSPIARITREKTEAEKAAKAEEEAAAYQRQKEFILDTKVGKHIAVTLLAELADEKRKAEQAIRSIISSCEKALAKLEKDEALSTWERLNRQTTDEYWEAVHRYNTFHAIVHRHPLGDLTESKYAQDEEARYRHGGEYRVW